MQLCLFLEQCFTWRKRLVQISVRPTKSEGFVAQKILHTDEFLLHRQNRHVKVTEKSKQTHASSPLPPCFCARSTNPNSLFSSPLISFLLCDLIRWSCGIWGPKETHCEPPGKSFRHCLREWPLQGKFKSFLNSSEHLPRPGLDSTCR